MGDKDFDVFKDGFSCLDKMGGKKDDRKHNIALSESFVHIVTSQVLCNNLRKQTLFSLFKR